MEDYGIKIRKKVGFCFFFWFFKNCELIKESSLWRSNFIHSGRNSVIIIGSRSITYTFGSHFIYKCWVEVSIKIWILAFCYCFVTSTKLKSRTKFKKKKRWKKKTSKKKRKQKNIVCSFSSLKPKYCFLLSSSFDSLFL